MKVVQINTVCSQGSTGKICVEISKLLLKYNIENYIFFTEGVNTYPYGIQYAGKWYKKIQALKSRVFGNFGFTSETATRRLINKIDEIKPDIIQIHNIHGHDCNLSMLFGYIRAHHIKVIWSLHDCWVLTGYCTHFTLVGCSKWETHCRECVQKKNYSWFFDNSSKNFDKKKKMLQGVDVTFVVPSHWLEGLLKRSYLKNYPVMLITNGLDLSVFSPVDSRFREKYHLNSKYVILGVAFSWGVKKGLDVFIELANRLNDDYKVVLVGTDDVVDKQLPQNILSVHKTNNQKELAEIYSAADVFVNPTREETFGMTNIEALACGTPVITFDMGGSPETIDETCGGVVPAENVEALLNQIQGCCEHKWYTVEACIKHAALFESATSFQKYIDLYRKVS